MTLNLLQAWAASGFDREIAVVNRHRNSNNWKHKQPVRKNTRKSSFSCLTAVNTFSALIGEV